MGLASLPPWPLPTRCRRPWRFPLLCLPVQPRQNRKADHQLVSFPTSFRLRLCTQLSTPGTDCASHVDQMLYQ